MNKYTDDDIARALRYDAIHEAEQIDGKDYKASESTTWLGFDLMRRNNAAKEQMLKSRDDVTWGTSLSEYMRIIQDIGFRSEASGEFESFINERDAPHTEAWHIFFHAEFGIVLFFDTYRSQSVINSGNYYYNWRPSPTVDNRFRMTSSGRMTRGGRLERIPRLS